MKFKVFLAQFFILFICVKLNAQIENEIKSFTDSTEVIVNNGRKMIVRSIINNENVKSIEIYNYLQNTVMGKGYAAFYYSEELNINLLLSNWAEWVNKAKQYNKYSNAFCHPNAYPISPIIFDELRKTHVVKA